MADEASSQGTAPQELPEDAVGIGQLHEDAVKRRQYVAIGLASLVAGASFFATNKKMATRTSILVGLVLGVVAYVGANMVLPPAVLNHRFFGEYKI